MYFFDARLLTISILKNCFDSLICMRKSIQMIFVSMLYNKNWLSYSNPCGEKCECWQEAKIGIACSTWITFMHPFKVALQKNGCSYSYQTLYTCTLNIYYQINANKVLFICFMFFGPLKGRVPAVNKFVYYTFLCNYV